jgi:carboxylate-amine ligase
MCPRSGKQFPGLTDLILDCAAGTHPFSHWESQLITDHVRYSEIVNELQEAARSNLIFGLHVHVGMVNREMANHIANSTRYFLPHIYALSTNSPFWEGSSQAISLSDKSIQ